MTRRKLLALTSFVPARASENELQTFINSLDAWLQIVNARFINPNAPINRFYEERTHYLRVYRAWNALLKRAKRVYSLTPEELNG